MRGGSTTGASSFVCTCLVEVEEPFGFTDVTYPSLLDDAFGGCGDGSRGNGRHHCVVIVRGVLSSLAPTLELAWVHNNIMVGVRCESV